MGSRNKHIRKKKARSAASKRQGGLCLWCGVPMISEGVSQNHPQAETADHLKPQSKKGGVGLNNIAAACFRCNTARKNHPIEVWLERVKLRLKQAGNPQHFEVILSILKNFGIDLDTGQPSNGPGSVKTLTVPPLTEQDPAPQG